MSSSLAVIVCKHEKTGGRKTGLHPGRLRLLARESVVAVSIYEKIGLLFRKPGFSSASASSAAGADRALIVTTPEVSAIRDADRIIGLLEASGIGRMDLIINRIRSDMVRRGDMMSVDDVMDILSVPVIGTVPDDEDIVISTNQGEPLVGMNGYAGQAYLNICKRILGESVPFIQLDASPGFWSRISGFLKRA